jgi:hypothetical protein
MILPQLWEQMDACKRWFALGDATLRLEQPESRSGSPEMERIMRAPNGQPQQELGHFWGRYFVEIPLCAHEGCDRIAQEVDPYFPYLDDHNRCDQHRQSWIVAQPVLS